MEKGGSTRPWMVLLSENKEETAYVVKLSNPKDHSNQYPIVKEVLGNLLAKEFALRVPDYVLADFSKDFINYALNEEQRTLLNTKHDGLKFATKLLDSSVVYAPTIHRSYLQAHDFANLFAYDVLIYNFDRGRTPEKPNLLIENDSLILIDHELSMPFIDNERGLYDSILKKLSFEEIDYPYHQHLSYSYLKSLGLAAKSNMFDEFEENLSKVNISVAERAIKDLTRLKIPCGHSERIIEYLYTLKRAPGLFCKALLKCIL